jgi:hypothetical protein
MTFVALQPLTAVSQSGRIAVISQNIAAQLEFSLEATRLKPVKTKLSK